MTRQAFNALLNEGVDERLKVILTQCGFCDFELDEIATAIEFVFEVGLVSESETVAATGA